jgi:4-hydroxybenzoate polyprenyltransferase
VSLPTPPLGGRARELGRFLEIQNLGLNLPFAFAFLVIAAGGVPSGRTLVLVAIAFIAARNAGHSFNRWSDRDLDARNPRTRERVLVTGRYRPMVALALTVANGAIVLLAAYFLNLLALALAPVALAIVLGYSLTKRYTWATTVVLGLVEGITPGAVYVAVVAALPWIALVAVAAMVLWGTAFETIHSLGDLDSDRALGLHSIPLALGVGRSIRLIPALHVAALVLFGAYVWLAGLAWAGLAAVVLMAALVQWVDGQVARRPADTLLPFRMHFVLASLFLLGTLVAVFVPGVR